eukprot:7502242-Pyramimonas_sp.AAC.1
MGPRTTPHRWSSHGTAAVAIAPRLAAPRGRRGCTCARAVRHHVAGSERSRRTPPFRWMKEESTKD